MVQLDKFVHVFDVSFRFDPAVRNLEDLELVADLREAGSHRLVQRIFAEDGLLRPQNRLDIKAYLAQFRDVNRGRFCNARVSSLSHAAF